MRTLNPDSRLAELLREMPGILRGAPESESLSFSPTQGLPLGALIGVSGSAGSGKTEIILKVLAENASARVAWVEDRFTVFPSALPQHGVTLDRVLFVEGETGSTAGESSLWTVHQLLRSQIFKIVIFSAQGSTLAQVQSEIVLRRLQLAAGKARAAVLLVSESPLQGATWPFSVQLQVQRSAETGEPVIHVIKTRRRSWKVSC